MSLKQPDKRGLSPSKKKVMFTDTEGEPLARSATGPAVSGPPGSNLYNRTGDKPSTLPPSPTAYITDEEADLVYSADNKKYLRLFADKMYEYEFKRLSDNYERENPKRIGESYDDLLSRKEAYAIQQLGDINKFFERYQDTLDNTDVTEEDKKWLDDLNKRYKNTTVDICSIAKDCVRVALGIFIGYMGYRYFQGGKTKKKSKKRRTIKRSKKCKKRRSIKRSKKRRSS